MESKAKKNEKKAMNLRLKQWRTKKQLKQGKKKTSGVMIRGLQ
jgi:hypothetical protein